MKEKSVLLNYVIRNKKNFLIIVALFLLGMIIGIFFINHANTSQIEEIKQYVSNLVENIKQYENINKTDLLVQSLSQNILVILLIWLLGCSIIGSGFILVTVIYRGFSLGYTISAIIACLGVKTGTLFAISALLTQNLFFLPAYFILSESGIKLYNGIRRHCINLKVEVIRHSLIMLISIILAVISSFVEVYISTNLLFFLKEFL